VSPKPPRSSKKARLTAARLAAIQVLYQEALTARPLAVLKAEFLEHYVGQKLDGDNFVIPDEAHLLAVMDGVHAYGWQLDQAIDGAIHAAQPDRKTENLEILLRLILRCSAFELKDKLAEKAIIINDYINIAKAFYDLKEPAFVNAVLDKLAKSQEL
jgi:N utilization substance protein B